jgi:hypothetical protein
VYVLEACIGVTTWRSFLDCITLPPYCVWLKHITWLTAEVVTVRSLGTDEVVNSFKNRYNS